MNRFFRLRLVSPTLRNQTLDKNIQEVVLPTHEGKAVKRTGFNKGDKAPFAHNDYFSYPSDYKPWTFNYKGNGLFYGTLALSIFSYFMYEETYLLRTGRKQRQERLYYKP